MAQPVAHGAFHFSASDLTPFALAVVLLRRRYKPIREALTAAPASSSLAWERGVIKRRLNGKIWKRRFETALRALGRDLERNEDDASRTAAAAIARIERPALTKLTKQARRVVIAALKNGSLESMLARIDGMLVYFLAFPDHHDDPRSIRRYESLADGWLAHVTRMAKVARKDQDTAAPLLSLLVFLRPDASEGSLLFGYHDGRLTISPGLVLEGSEGRGAAGRVHAEAYPLALAGAHA